MRVKTAQEKEARERIIQRIKDSLIDIQNLGNTYNGIRQNLVAISRLLITDRKRMNTEILPVAHPQKYGHWAVNKTEAAELPDDDSQPPELPIDENDDPVDNDEPEQDLEDYTAGLADAPDEQPIVTKTRGRKKKVNNREPSCCG